MRKRVLGKTGLYMSEIGFGGEWLERHPEEESIELMKYASEKGINIIDCWMPDPKSRDIIGKAMLGNRDKWYVQGHLGSTWQAGQYVRTRDIKYVKPAFEDYIMPNEKELMTISKQEGDTFEEIEAAAKTLIARGVKNVLVTLGSHGAMHVTKETYGQNSPDR